MNMLTKLKLLGIGLFLVAFRKKLPLIVVKIAHKLLALVFRALKVRRNEHELGMKDIFKSHRDDDTHGYKVPSMEHVSFRTMTKNIKIDGENGNNIDAWRAAMKSNPLMQSVFEDWTTKLLTIPAQYGNPTTARTGLPLHEIIAEGVEKNGAILYLHGGGYVAGSPNFYNGILGKMSRTASLPVYALDYRLCPEFSMADQMEDCLAAYEYLVKELGFEPQKIAVAGDSAGGGLTLGLLQTIVERKLDSPACGVLISPFGNLAGDTESYRVNADSDELLSASLINQFEVSCVPPGKTTKDPKLSYAYGKYKKLAPLYITASETEMLYTDAVEIRAAALKENVEVVFESAAYGPHIYPLFADFAPEYHESFIKLCAYMRKTVLHGGGKSKKHSKM